MESAAYSLSKNTSSNCDLFLPNNRQKPRCEILPASPRDNAVTTTNISYLSSNAEWLLALGFFKSPNGQSFNTFNSYWSGQSRARLVDLTPTDLTKSDLLAGWTEKQFPHVMLSPFIAVRRGILTSCSAKSNCPHDSYQWAKCQFDALLQSALLLIERISPLKQNFHTASQRQVLH